MANMINAIYLLLRAALIRRPERKQCQLHYILFAFPNYHVQSLTAWRSYGCKHSVIWFCHCWLCSLLCYKSYFVCLESDLLGVCLFMLHEVVFLSGCKALRSSTGVFSSSLCWQSLGSGNTPRSFLFMS
jgi:hypothetical protein